VLQSAAGLLGPACLLRRGLPRADQRCLGCRNTVPLTCLCWIVCCTTRCLCAADLGCGLVPAPGPSASCSSLEGWREPGQWARDKLLCPRAGRNQELLLARSPGCVLGLETARAAHAQRTPRTPYTLHTKKQSKNTNHARTALQRRSEIPPEISHQSRWNLSCRCTTPRANRSEKISIEPQVFITKYEVNRNPTKTRN
jgi:hypothetical protein